MLLRVFRGKSEQSGSEQSCSEALDPGGTATPSPLSSHGWQLGANALPGQRGAEESLGLASLAVYLFARDN